MRAALLRDGSDRLSIEDLEHSELMAREVLVRTAACGLCHSDLHVIDGTLQRPRPHLLGHEAAGVVEALGTDVTSVAMGDHVVTCLVQGCGSCRRCLQGQPTLCTDPAATRRASALPPRLRTLGGEAVSVMANVGGFTEQMVLDERGLVVVPDDVPMDLAALLGCAVVTGVGAVFNVGEVQAGESVAVIGCGGVGLNVIQAARIAGASPIIAVDVSAAKLAMALSLGATAVVDASSTDAVVAVRDLTGGGVDHAFEVIGRPATAEQALAMAANGCRAYVVGVMADDATFTVRAEYTKRGKSLHGVYMGATLPHVDIPRYVELWRRGELDLAAMVSRRLALDEINDGFRALAAGEVNRAVVVFT